MEKMEKIAKWGNRENRECMGNGKIRENGEKGKGNGENGENREMGKRE